MVLFKELCFTTLTMLAECISSLTHHGLVYVVKIPPKDKKSQHKISPKVLKRNKTTKTSTKIDLFSLKKIHMFPRTFRKMYRHSLASTAQGEEWHYNTNEPRQPCVQQALRQPCRWRAASTIHHIKRALKKPQTFLSAVPTPRPHEKTSHKGTNKRGTSLSRWVSGPSKCLCENGTWSEERRLMPAEGVLNPKWEQTQPPRDMCQRKMPFLTCFLVVR